MFEFSFWNLSDISWFLCRNSEIISTFIKKKWERNEEYFYFAEVLNFWDERWPKFWKGNKKRKDLNSSRWTDNYFWNLKLFYDNFAVIISILGDHGETVDDVRAAGKYFHFYFYRNAFFILVPFLLSLEVHFCCIYRYFQVIAYHFCEILFSRGGLDKDDFVKKKFGGIFLSFGTFLLRNRIGICLSSVPVLK